MTGSRRRVRPPTKVRIGHRRRPRPRTHSQGQQRLTSGGLGSVDPDDLGMRTVHGFRHGTCAQASIRPCLLFSGSRPIDRARPAPAPRSVHQDADAFLARSVHRRLSPLTLASDPRLTVPPSGPNESPRLGIARSSLVRSMNQNDARRVRPTDQSDACDAADNRRSSTPLHARAGRSSSQLHPRHGLQPVGDRSHPDVEPATAEVQRCRETDHAVEAVHRGPEVVTAIHSGPSRRRGSAPLRRAPGRDGTAPSGTSGRAARTNAVSTRRRRRGTGEPGARPSASARQTPDVPPRTDNRHDRVAHGGSRAPR